MRRSWWRLLVCLFMVPVVFVQSSAVASGMGKTQWAGAEVSLAGMTIPKTGLSVQSSTCGFSVRLQAVGAGEFSGLSCYGGPDMSPGGAQMGEPGGSFTVSLAGPGCVSGYSGTLDEGSHDSMWHTHGVKAGGVWSAGTDCEPTQACVRLEGLGSFDYRCTPVNLVAAAGPVVGCPSFDVVSVRRRVHPSGVSYAVEIKLRLAKTITNGTDGRVFVYQMSKSSGVWAWSVDAGVPSFTGSAGDVVTIVRPYPTLGAGSDSWGPGLLGWGFYKVGDTAAGATSNQVSSAQLVSDSNVDGNGVIGQNRAAKCAFYYGEKVGSTSSNDFDEPTPDPGVLAEEPSPGDDSPPPGVEPEDDPVVTDEPSFWSSVLAALMALIRAVGGLVGALLDGIKALLVPDPSSWGWEGLKTQLEARPPASVVVGLGGSLGGMVSGYTGAGSCGTLADFGDGMKIDCNAIKGVPGWSILYGVVQVGIVGIGAFSVFHIVRSAVGSSA